MNLTKKQENTLEEIKSFESEPKVVQLFDNKEISKLLDLYNSLPITTHNITQKTIKKDGYKIIVKKWINFMSQS